MNCSWQRYQEAMGYGSFVTMSLTSSLNSKESPGMLFAYGWVCLPGHGLSGLGKCRLYMNGETREEVVFCFLSGGLIDVRLSLFEGNIDKR